MVLLRTENIFLKWWIEEKELIYDQKHSRCILDADKLQR